MNTINSLFPLNFIVAALMLIVMSILVLFFERKFIGITQKRLGISFLGRNGWLHLPADIIKFWSKSSFKNSSLWLFNSLNIFIVLAVYYLWNLLSLVFFTNNQNSLNFDYSPFEIFLYFIYANLTTLYLFFIIVNVKSKYATIGATRIILVNIFLEFSFALNFYFMYIYSGGFSFDDFSEVNSYYSYFLSLPISSFIFLIYTLYEAKRAPFDHAEAESELVAGHIIEFSGKSLLFFFFSEYIHLYFCIFLIMLFFFGNFETLLFIQLFFFDEPTYYINNPLLAPIEDVNAWLVALEEIDET